ncbi:MAG: homoserine dehydrogenase [Nitrospira sp.]
MGIIGFGTVGTGLVRILLQQKDLLLRRLGIPLEIAAIADHDAEKDRGISLPPDVLTTNAAKIIQDPDIDIVVELIGGTGPAKQYILDAIEGGKHVVTANKALLATHGEEIFQTAAVKGVDVGFEASVCGAIPILRSMKEGLVAEKISAIYGIVNGTCNYILTKMSEEGKAFADVLQEAQDLGYAEADPTLDIDGADSAHKLAILANLAFGTPISLKDIYTEGLERVSSIDINFAEKFGYKIKLLAIAKSANGEIEARVHPTMIQKNTLLSRVGGVFNAVYLIGDSAGEVLFYGKGAGALPTGSAVVSDIISLARDIIKGTSGRVPATAYIGPSRKKLRIKRIEEIESLYYLRFMAEDDPGVLSKISGILGENRIGISSVIQQGRKIGGHVPLVMMTHRAREKDVRQALSNIDNRDYVSEQTMLIRVEGDDE